MQRFVIDMTANMTAMKESLTVDMAAMEERITAKITARSRRSSPVTQPVTQPATPPSPPTPQQEATQLATQQKNRKRNKKTRQQYKRKALQQANVENIAEKTAGKTQHDSSSKATTVNNISLLSTIPHHATTSMHREVFIRLDKTPMYLLASRITSRLASRVTFLCQHDWPPPYIRQAEDLEATGQG